MVLPKLRASVSEEMDSILCLPPLARPGPLPRW